MANDQQIETAEEAEKRALGQKLGTIGWALFFIWIGVGFLLGMNIGLALLGLGVIALALQIARGVNRVKLEWFWVGVGALFFLGGIWELTDPDVPLVPVLLILAGVLLLLSVIIGKGGPKHG